MAWTSARASVRGRSGRAADSRQWLPLWEIFAGMWLGRVACGCDGVSDHCYLPRQVVISPARVIGYLRDPAAAPHALTGWPGGGPRPARWRSAPLAVAPAVPACPAMQHPSRHAPGTAQKLDHSGSTAKRRAGDGRQHNTKTQR